MRDNRIWNLAVKMTTHGLSGMYGILLLLAQGLAGVWHLPVQQKAGQLCVTLRPQLLLWCLKVGESQSQIHSCSGTSFIHLSFCLTTAIFSLLLNFTCDLSFARGNTPTPTQTRPDTTKTSKYSQRAKLRRHGYHHMFRGPKAMIEQHYFCVSLYFIFERKILLTPPLTDTLSVL